VPIVMKSGSLNLLEPSGPVQACNGIALHLSLHMFSITGGTGAYVSNISLFISISNYSMLISMIFEFFLLDFLSNDVGSVDRLVCNYTLLSCSVFV
jgi:hypothetical protein